MTLEEQIEDMVDNPEKYFLKTRNIELLEAILFELQLLNLNLKERL